MHSLNPTTLVTGNKNPSLVLHTVLYPKAQSEKKKKKTPQAST
jgi:hypothetical protein